MSLADAGIVLSNVNCFTPVGVNQNLNAAPATLQLACMFDAQGTDILDFYLAVFAVYGTNENIALQFELQADNAGIPSGAALATTTKTGGWPTGPNGGCTLITPNFGVTLTVNNRYWIVIKNISSSPTVNYISAARIRSMQTPAQTSYAFLGDWIGSRVWNGTNWTTNPATNSTALSIRFNNGVILSEPIYRYQYDSSGAFTTNTIGGAPNIGCRFKSPDYDCNIQGIAVFLATDNSATIPPITLALRINNVVVAISRPVKGIAASTASALAFGTLLNSVVIPAGSECCIVTHSVTLSSSAYTTCIRYFRADDETYKQSFLWDAYATSISSAGVVTDELTGFMPMALVLDKKNPFPRSINRRQYYNQR